MDIMNLLTGILVPCVLFAFTWLGKLSGSVTDLRVHVADNYVKKNDMEDTIDPVRHELKHIRKVVEAVARNLHVPAVSED